MPTYEYQCQSCGYRFERFQSITADPVRVCPKCGRRRVKRLIGTGGAIIFKGPGFYITDYRSESYKKRAKDEREAARKAEGGSSSDEGKSSGSGED